MLRGAWCGLMIFAWCGHLMMMPSWRWRGDSGMLGSAVEIHDAFNVMMLRR